MTTARAITLPSLVGLALCLAPASTSTQTPFDLILSLVMDEGRSGDTGRRREAPLAGNASVEPEAFMTTPDIIRNYGYPAEEHTVETEDGYLIEIHRIPSKGVPVLVMHGLLCSSVVWVDNTVNISLAFLLSDVGFDVWLGNVRGNSYGRKHRTLDPSEKKFWDFTLDEHAQYDISAIIDYILKTTEFQKILYMGHSLGTAEIFALLSRKPEYKEKVKGVAALAPISVLGNLRSSVKTYVSFAEAIRATMEFFGQNEMMGAGYIGRKIQLRFCRKRTEDNRFHLTRVCKEMIKSSIGQDDQQLNETRIPVYLQHVPAGTSLKTLYHLAQLVRSKKFSPFDYGSARANEAVYKSPFPPEYEMREVTVPVSLFWSDNDLLSDSRDVKWLADQLPNIHLNHHIPYTLFTHADFMWAIDARNLLYNKVVSTLQSMWEL